MTKTEFLAQLDSRLRVLPDSERRDALEYYDGYLSDANKDGEGNGNAGMDEAAAIVRLGTPGEVAAQIMADYAVHRTATRKAKQGSVKSVWFIILALFAVPIGLPVAIAVAAVAFSLLVTLLSVILSFGVAGIACVIGGVSCAIISPFVLVQHFGLGLATIGSAVLAAGLGLVFIRLTIMLFRDGLGGISRFVGKTILHRNPVKPVARYHVAE